MPLPDSMEYIPQLALKEEWLRLPSLLPLLSKSWPA